jgi:hypothetical protein
MTPCAPRNQTTYVWKDAGSPLQFEVIMLVAVLFLCFWLWVVSSTVERPREP